MKQRIVVVGGGAAGYFAAIAAAESEPRGEVTLLERSAHPLAKVRISGGGRCNVTNACFDPAVLVMQYPRGGKALRGPFNRFQPRDTMTWFTDRGVPLKTEPDGRVFPVSNLSQSIIDCLQTQAQRAGVDVRLNAVIETVEKSIAQNSSEFKLSLAGKEQRTADRLILATGSNPQAWQWAQSLGHSLVPPVPSLFTFTIKDPRLESLAGISTASSILSLEGTPLCQTGPVLITHWGLSGPAILKLSAWGARVLHACDYHAKLRINWVGDTFDRVNTALSRQRERNAVKLVASTNLPILPRSLWTRLVRAAGIAESARWGEVGNVPLRALTTELTDGVYTISGKSTFKEEFVTCGGIPLDEVDFRRLESKKCPGLFFAGEILDVDGVTGGFNFQNAWTTGYIAGQSAVANEEG